MQMRCRVRNRIIVGRCVRDRIDMVAVAAVIDMRLSVRHIVDMRGVMSCGVSRVRNRIIVSRCVRDRIDMVAVAAVIDVRLSVRHIVDMRLAMQAMP